MSVAAVLGSAFTRAELGSWSLTPETISTLYGEVRLHRAELASPISAFLVEGKPVPFRNRLRHH